MHEACRTWQDQSPASSVLIHQGYHLYPDNTANSGGQLTPAQRRARRFLPRERRAAVLMHVAENGKAREARAWSSPQGNCGETSGEIRLRRWIFFSFLLVLPFVSPILIRIKSHDLNIKRTSAREWGKYSCKGKDFCQGKHLGSIDILRADGLYIFIYKNNH